MSLPNFQFCFQVTAGAKRVTRGKRAPSFVPRALTASTALSSAMPARTAATVCTDTSASASTAGVERTAPSRLSAWLEVNTAFEIFSLVDTKIDFRRFGKELLAHFPDAGRAAAGNRCANAGLCLSHHQH